MCRFALAPYRLDMLSVPLRRFGAPVLPNCGLSRPPLLAVLAYQGLAPEGGNPPRMGTGAMNSQLRDCADAITGFSGLHTCQRSRYCQTFIWGVIASMLAFRFGRAGASAPPCSPRAKVEAQSACFEQGHPPPPCSPRGACPSSPSGHAILIEGIPKLSRKCSTPREERRCQEVHGSSVECGTAGVLGAFAAQIFPTWKGETLAIFSRRCFRTSRTAGGKMGR